MTTVVQLLAGSAALATAWAGGKAVVVLVLAAVVPYLLIRILSVSERPWLISIAAALIPVTTAAVFVSTAKHAGPLQSLTDAIPQLLTAPRPASTDLLLPGVFLAVLVGVWVGVRESPRGKGMGMAPLAGATVLYVVGALLTAGVADRYGVLAATIVVGSVAGWISQERRWPAVARALPFTMCALAAAGLLSTAIPTASRFEPRHLVSPPELPLKARNPLPKLAELLEKRDAELLRYAGPQARLRLVALNTFDGATWQAEGNYRPLGAVAAPDVLASAPRRTNLTLDVTIAALDGLWLPSPGNPTAVSIPEAVADADSESLALPTGLRAGLRYTVRGSTPIPTEDVIVADVPTPARYVEVPRLPYALADYSQSIVQSAKTPFEQAVLIEKVVGEDRRLSDTAPGGSSYARLVTFLLGARGTPGAQEGTSEQFATAFAVLARAVGLPTRVVIGFGQGDQHSDGTRVVRGRHAMAWPEIYFRGQGWVTFNPTPSIVDTSPQSPYRHEVLERVGGYEPSTPTPTPSVGQVDPTATAPAPSAPSPVRLPSVGMLATIIGGALATPMGMVAALRTMRRWRHRRAGPAGAWSEVLDLLVLMRQPPARWHSATQIAGDIMARVPAAAPHPAVLLAERADRAAFAPRGSTLAGAWSDLRRLKRAVRREVPWLRRILWPVDPRPLLRQPDSGVTRQTDRR